MLPHLLRPRNIGLAFGVIAMAFAFLAWLSNRQPFPADPQLASVSLELPQNPAPSRALNQLLTRRGEKGMTEGVIWEGCQAIKEQRWPEDPGAVLHALSELNKPSLETFREALLTSGCLSATDHLVQAPEFNLWHLHQHIEYLILRAVVLGRGGEIQRGVDELEALQYRLLTIQRSCAHTMGATMIIEVALQRVLGAWGFLLAVPEQGDLDLQPRIWPLVRALATRESPMPDALRREHQFLVAATGLATEPWPIFDREATLQVLEQLSRRLVWLAELPAASEALVRPTPEERFFDQLHNMPSWRLILRYNSQGLLALSMNVTVMRARLLKWNIQRCHAAASYALWMGNIRKRGRPLAAEAAPPPDNPFTGSPFGEEELMSSDLPMPCLHPLEPDPVKGPTVAAPLPPAPPAPPTSAPAQSPSAP